MLLRNFLEGRASHIMTDHRPLTYAFCGHHGCNSVRETTHLGLILEFTADLRYIKGVGNVVGDDFLRVEAALPFTTRDR